MEVASINTRLPYLRVKIRLILDVHQYCVRIHTVLRVSRESSWKSRPNLASPYDRVFPRRCRTAYKDVCDAYQERRTSFPPCRGRLLHEKGSFVFRFLVSFVGRCLGDVFIYEFFNIGCGNLVVVVVDGRMTSLPPKRGKGKRRKVASLGMIFCQVSHWELLFSFLRPLLVPEEEAESANHSPINSSLVPCPRGGPRLLSLTHSLTLVVVVGCTMN